jgi:hypothetical protein
VLRARASIGIEQEIYALLVVYQLLRTAMAEATRTRPDPDSTVGTAPHTPAATSSGCNSTSCFVQRPNTA